MSDFNNNINGYLGPFTEDPFSARTGVEEGANHFETPIFTSMLYDFTNKEKDLVQKCWRVGNFHSLRDLPAHIAPSKVMKSYQEKQDIAHLPHRPRVTALSDGGYFSRFEWQPESYDDYLDKEKGERESHKEIIEKLHKDKKFVAGSAYAPLKYEDQFQISDKKVSKSEIVPKDPFFSDNDPYEATIEEVLKNKWMEEAKRLHGEFHAGSKESINKKAQRNLLGNMVAKIKKTILEDWQEINFVIGTNPEEFIEIKFDGQTVDIEGIKY